MGSVGETLRSAEPARQAEYLCRLLSEVAAGRDLGPVIFDVMEVGPLPLAFCRAAFAVCRSGKLCTTVWHAILLPKRSTLLLMRRRGTGRPECSVPCHAANHAASNDLLLGIDCY